MRFLCLLLLLASCAEEVEYEYVPLPEEITWISTATMRSIGGTVDADNLISLSELRAPPIIWPKPPSFPTLFLGFSETPIQSLGSPSGAPLRFRLDDMRCSLPDPDWSRAFSVHGELSEQSVSADLTADWVCDCSARITQMAVGGKHSCVVIDHNIVRCWGSGSDGQLGIGNANDVGDDELASIDVDVGGAVERIVPGGNHTCALLQDGNVRCWGQAIYGQLGYGSTAIIGVEISIVNAGNVDIGGPVRDLAAGSDHNCVILESGAVRCWGRNDDGQLGYSHTETIGDDETPSVAGDVDTQGEVAQIVAGQRHTCVLYKTGSVRCWGSFAGDEIGYAGTDAVQVVVGDTHACVLLSSGSVRCWGASPKGELGYGDNVSRPNATATEDLDVGGKVVQISAADSRTCAVLEGGTVRCWGEGRRGRLGYGNEENVGDDETPGMMGDVDVGGTVIQVDTGDTHTCVLLSTGMVRCWGSGYLGQLGYGNAFNLGVNEAPASAGDVPLRGTSCRD